MSGDVEALAERCEAYSAAIAGNSDLKVGPRMCVSAFEEAAAMLRAQQAENERLNQTLADCRTMLAATGKAAAEHAAESARLRAALEKCAYAADGWEIDQANSAARSALGLTQHQMAEALQMGKHGWQTISSWETGKTPIPGPVAVAVRCLVNHRD